MIVLLTQISIVLKSVEFATSWVKKYIALINQKEVNFEVRQQILHKAKKTMKS